MATSDTLRYTRIPLNNGSGAIPAVGFGTLIPDPVATKQSTETALEVGFRHFDCDRHALILTKSFLENLVVALARLIGLI